MEAAFLAFNMYPLPDDPGAHLRAAVLTAAIRGHAAQEPRLARAVLGRAEATLAADTGAPTTERTPRQPITLVLPGEKAHHLQLYRRLAREKRLVATPDYDRTVSPPAQVERWITAMSPKSGDGMPEWAFQEGMRLTGDDEKRVLLPNWSRQAYLIAMQVDHVVELQLTRLGDREWADSISNYELLDGPSNQRAGAKIRTSVRRERDRLIAQEGPQWRGQDLVFDDVVIESSGTPQRWTASDMRHGEHVDALREHLRARGQAR